MTDYIINKQSQKYTEAGAAMIARNEGREHFDEMDLARAQWAWAGITQAMAARPKVAAGHGAVVSHDGGGNIHESGPTALGGPPDVLREKSTQMGYTGEMCNSCSNFTMRRNGTCLVCATCGATSGCS